MAIFRSPANEKDQINNGLAAGAFLSLAPRVLRAPNCFLSLLLSSACHAGYCQLNDSRDLQGPDLTNNLIFFLNLCVLFLFFLPIIISYNWQKQTIRDYIKGGFPLSRKFYVGYARVFHWLYLNKIQKIV